MLCGIGWASKPSSCLLRVKRVEVWRRQLIVVPKGLYIAETGAVNCSQPGRERYPLARNLLSKAYRFRWPKPGREVPKLLMSSCPRACLSNTDEGRVLVGCLPKGHHSNEKRCRRKQQAIAKKKGGHFPVLSRGHHERGREMDVPLSREWYSPRQSYIVDASVIES